MKNKIIQNMIRKMEAGRTMHRKNAMKLTAVALCTALFLGETGVTMYALAADNKAGQETSETNETTDTSSGIDTAENTDTTQPQNKASEEVQAILKKKPEVQEQPSVQKTESCLRKKPSTCLQEPTEAPIKSLSATG